MVAGQLETPEGSGRRSATHQLRRRTLRAHTVAQAHEQPPRAAAFQELRNRFFGERNRLTDPHKKNL